MNMFKEDPVLAFLVLCGVWVFAALMAMLASETGVW